MSSGSTLLLVEDNEDDAFAFQYLLRKAGVPNPALEIVADGQQAMEYLGGVGRYADRERFPLPAMVFLDLKLPFYSGHEILEWIRGESGLHSLPVVILSGSDESRDRELAEANGALSYLVKPASREQIEAALKAEGLSFESVSRD